MTETTRQRKVAQLLQEELSKIFQKDGKDFLKGTLVSVLEVKISVDLSVAKVYISVFPHEHRKPIFDEIKSMELQYRRKLGSLVGKQLRIVPHLALYLDESIDNAERIEIEIQGQGENPIL